MTDREKYLPGPTDTAALALGGESDDDEQTRREAVQSVVGHLQRNEGLGATSAGILREKAWSVDSQTADSPRRAWTEYLRPALCTLDTVETVGDGRWRYVGPSKAAATERAAASPMASDGDTDDGSQEQASLSERQREAHSIVAFAAATGMSPDEVRERRQAGRDPAAPALSALDRGSDRDRNADAALAAGTIDGGPTPSPSTDERDESADSPVLDSDSRLSKSVSWRPGVSGNDERAALDADSERESDSDADDRTCAVCDETQPVGTNMVPAPVLDGRFAADGSDVLCRNCFASLAAGSERADGL